MIRLKSVMKFGKLLRIICFADVSSKKNKTDHDCFIEILQALKFLD